MLEQLFAIGNKNQDNSKGSQLYFRNDEKFFFRKVPIISGALVRKKGEQFIEAWLHRPNNQFIFDGYKNMPGGKITVSSARDVVFDPFDIISKEDKPDKTGEIKQNFITKMSNNAIYAAQKQKVKGMIMDKVTLGIVIVTVLMGLAFFISRIT